MMEKFLSKKQVCEMCSFAAATLDRYENPEKQPEGQRLPEGKRFPKRVKIGFRVFWVLSEVQAWIQARIAERDSTD
jgi:predicted DNA-binding transcriptional regulator AlpA